MQGKADYLGINRFQKPFLKVNAYLAKLVYARYMREKQPENA